MRAYFEEIRCYKYTFRFSSFCWTGIQNRISSKIGSRVFVCLCGGGGGNCLHIRDPFSLCDSLTAGDHICFYVTLCLYVTIRVFLRGSLDRQDHQTVRGEMAFVDAQSDISRCPPNDIFFIYHRSITWLYKPTQFFFVR